MTTLADLKTRIEIIEETYEFMLAYAAQGLDGDEGSKSGGQLRDFLVRADEAVAKLAPEFRELVSAESLEPSDQYNAFIDVIEQDAKAASAGLQLVLAQGSISSQLVDNMNASIHLRALLTDLFLIDEIVKRALAKG
ncbi:MAG: hypothetical protein ACE5FA_12090 [Dehalococcoidia bacterium]